VLFGLVKKVSRQRQRASERDRQRASERYREFIQFYIGVTYRNFIGFKIF